MTGSRINSVHVLGSIPNHSDLHSNIHAQTSGIHVDLPGEHGNTASVPVVHRPGTESHVNPHSSTSIHVDLPGQHGNLSPNPVVHREVGHGAPSDFVPGHKGSVHVDLPGEHGNLSPVAVVHRDTWTGHTTGGVGTHTPPVHGSAGHVGGVHVDRPGEHGNLSPVPVLHREFGTGHFNDGFLPSFPGGHHTGGTHVDRPGEHGNNSPHLVLHRGSGEPQHGAGNVHVDLPGEHCNNSPHPVVHGDHGSSSCHTDTHPVHPAAELPVDLPASPMPGPFPVSGNIPGPLTGVPPPIGDPIPLFDVPMFPSTIIGPAGAARLPMRIPPFSPRPFFMHPGRIRRRRMRRRLRRLGMLGLLPGRRMFLMGRLRPPMRGPLSSGISGNLGSFND